MLGSYNVGDGFATGSLVDTPLGKLTRIVTSRSQDTQNTDSRLMSKLEGKIAAVEMAISVLLAVEALNKQERKEQDSGKLA